MVRSSSSDDGDDLRMRACFKTLFFLSLFLLNTVNVLATDTHSIQRWIEKPLGAVKQPAFFGMALKSMTTGKWLYQSHGDYHFAPASTLKLFTATAALAYLGPYYRFHTQLKTDAKLEQGSLSGDLWIQFSGDPSLTHEALEQLLRQLKAEGIARIQGRIHIDDTAFDELPYPPGSLWDDFSYAYGAPIEAVILDENKAILKMARVKSMRANASSLILLSTPKLPFPLLHFDNALRVTKSTRHCPVAIYSEFHNHYELRGCFADTWTTAYRQLAITDPVAYARLYIEKDLKALGISYSGAIDNRRAPPKSRVIADYSSKPLSELITRMLKDSNNVIANALFKTLGHVYFSESGGWENSREALKKILTPHTKINFKETLIADGAGLSRYNLVTPQQFIQLLDYAYHDKRVAPTLIHGLPVAGRDGTLAYRMQLLKPPYVVRGKTGTMTGVTGLAGFITTKRQEVYAYSVLVNQFIGKSRPYRHLEDEICQNLATQKTLS